MGEKIILTKSSERSPEVNRELRKIFLVISVFFGIFFLAVIYTIYIAQKNFEPIFDKRYVEKGMNYSERNNELKRFKEHQWKVDVNLLNTDKINKRFSLEISLSNSTEYFKNFRSDENRKTVIIKISYPASIKKYYEFEFLEKDFDQQNQKFVLKKELEISSSGFFEFQVEIRPEKDVAFFKSKKIYVE